MKENKTNPARKTEELSDDALDQVSGGGSLKAISDSTRSWKYDTNTAMPGGFDKARIWVAEKDESKVGR